MENAGKAAGYCYPAALINEACPSYDYAAEILAANGVDIHEKPVRSMTQINTSNQTIGSLIIEQHIVDQNLDEANANCLGRIYGKWSQDGSNYAHKIANIKKPNMQRDQNESYNVLINKWMIHITCITRELFIQIIFV